jgi:hypothetical protein
MLFKQLFPSVTPFGSSRFRESSVFNFLGNVSSQLGTIEYDVNLNFVFQAQANVDETLEPFPNWQAKYSPSDDSNGDNFTSLLRFNLSEYIGVRWSRCDRLWQPDENHTAAFQCGEYCHTL